MYIKKLKDLISTTLDDYRNERYSAQHNQLILQKIWPTFITLVKFYAIIGIIYIIIYNSLYFSTFNKPYTTFYFYIQLVAIVLYVGVVERIIHYIRESYKLRLIIFTFILIETSFQMFLIEVYLTNQIENRELTICQLFINLLLVLVIVRTIKLRIMILLKCYVYYFVRGITFHFQTLQSINILFFIILILYLWDQQLINLSKVSQFTDQTLKSIPSAVCVLDQNCQDVLFTNNFTKRLINSLNFGGLSGTKSINLANKQGFPSQESILSSASSEIVSFFENLTLPQSEVKEQFNSNSLDRLDSKLESTDQNQINLNQALKLIKNLEKQTYGCIYTLRCQYENQNYGNEYPIIVEARIKTKLQYGLNKNAILLNLYDVSPNFKSSYYKKLNQFKSQVIRSISHELRTRLNVIQGFLQVIQCNSLNYDKETNKLLRAAFNNCRIQNLIISSIINYNLIREKKLVTKIEKCKLLSVIQEAIDLFQEEAEMKNIRIIFQKQINQVQNENLDYEKFQSILIHIISNSIKFNNKSGQIYITITKGIQEKDKIIHNKENEKKTIQPSYGSQLYRSSQDLNESSFHFPLRKNTIFKQQFINPPSSFSNAQPQQTNTHIYEYYIIEIRDSGMGIDQQKLEAIQNLLKNEEKSFQDLDRDSASGMMLGLRASNALIKYISGKEEDNYITIDSVEDQGTTVCIHVKCRITQLTEGFMPSDLYNKEGSQIELEGKILDIESQSFKFNIWTDPENSSRTNMINKTKKSSSNNINMTNKKGSVQMISNNNISSFYRNMEGSLFKSSGCTCEQKIVIVDDEPYNLLVLESLLKQLGYQSIKADNGKQCVHLIETSISLFDEHKCQGYKAIIMDYQMPIMNGQEATQKIKFLFKDQSRIQIPIFGLTGFSGEDDLINLTDAGMKEVYIKPITLKTLEEMINKLNQTESRDTPCLSSRQFQCFELNYADDLEQLAHE
ncbi:unnamed protein product [Paramecium primaurelia]|uniref:Uncharacterized protein n=1 Tax=Paramecium primaurelia TaxID=5886 RepID=A0A8S1JX60_PARPR|nr:unnamed protein product [Paramecium primaurelia]